MSKAEQIVYRLLEMDDAKKFIMQQPPPPLDPPTKQFQNYVVTFIEWKAREAPDFFSNAKADIAEVKKARDFSEIEAVLMRYDENDFTDFVATL